MNLCENHGIIAGVDFWPARQSVAGTLPRFTSLVVVNFGPKNYAPPG
jgi:hypothetical protein